MAVDKKANFIRIAEARTNKIIESITLLGNLSSFCRVGAVFMMRIVTRNILSLRV